MTDVILDTNVPRIADISLGNGAFSVVCKATCLTWLKRVVEGQYRIIIDDRFLILREYSGVLRQSRGIGSEFLKWLLQNQANTEKRVRIPITPTGDDENEFAEFPDDPELQGFDRNDRKFVAVAIAHGSHPPIINATDTDWYDYAEALQKHGVRIEQICPDELRRRGRD